MSKFKIAKKPAILADKIKLAELIRKNWLTIGKIDTHPSGGVYWKGTFESIGGEVVHIYFQRYVLGFRIGMVDFVSIRWGNKNKPNYFDALKPTEIKNLLARLTCIGDASTGDK